MLRRANRYGPCRSRTTGSPWSRARPGGGLLRGVILAALVAAAGCAGTPPGALPPYRIVGEAIPAPLTAAPPDASRGRELVMGRDGNCLLCHAIPETGARFMGDLGPPLSGVGARLSAGALRLRIVDSMQLNPETIMPSYYRVAELNRVGAAWRGKPVLTAQQVEDVVAFLLTLR